MKNSLSKQTNVPKYTSIPKRVLLYIAYKNLVNKKLRVTLTIIGVVIGIGSIFFLLSLGLGLRNLVTQEIIGDQSLQSIEVTSPNSRIIKLDESGVSRIKGLPNIEQTSLVFIYPGSLKFSGSESDTIVYGVDSQYQTMTSLRLTHGRLIEKNDHKVALINRAALSSIGINDDKQAIDQKLLLNVPLSNTDAVKNQILDEYKIIGVIDSGSGGEVFIPRFSFEAAGLTTYSQLKVLTKESGHLDDLRKQIESLGYETSSPSDTISQINEIFRIFTAILTGFGAIGMIVAVLGMFNTLTVALLERTKEIGLMVAMGGRHSDMRRLFIMEALILSLVGAIVGIIAASIGGSFINLIMNTLARQRSVSENFDLFSTPFWLIFVMIIFMVMVGLAVAYLPARRAQKINPIDALRRE